jgi:endonuclease/exonuclease/phosphatase (EEP) superfamily protein YafD
VQGRLTRALWIAAAFLHLAAVLALFVVFDLRPKTGWAAFLLYSPRLPFTLPALITFIALRGAWRLLPALTAAIVLGPLMGLHVNGPGRAGSLRLVTWNVWFGAGDPEVVRATLLRANPDLVLFQAAAHRVDVVLKEAPFSGFTYLHEDQYVLASRWPARVVQSGDPSGGWRPWVRFAVDSPWGTMDVFSVHPHSPRSLLRGSVRRGMQGERPEMDSLESDLTEIDELVRHGGPLMVVAGDFNVPERAGILMGMFGGTEDAFAAAGNGYGYTFPALGKRGRMPPWLRLDRVLTGARLRATRAEVVAGRGSDHAALVVDLAPR